MMSIGMGMAARRSAGKSARVAILGAAIAGASPLVLADIQFTGNVSPAAPASWWRNVDGYIGQTANGSATINGGSVLQGKYTYIGYNPGVAGEATVSGTGSMLTGSYDLYVGYQGSGTLNVLGGGAVNYGTVNLGYSSGASGNVTVSGAGSTWTSNYSVYVGRSGSGSLTVSDGGQLSAGTLYASVSNLHGNGTITAAGTVLDGTIQFGAGATSPVVAFGSGGVLTLNQASTTELGVGYKGTGSLSIADGLTVTSATGKLGMEIGSSGTALVSGGGTKWVTGSGLSVGYRGAGALTISGGAEVSGTDGEIGVFDGASGTAIVTGAGSKWTNGDNLRVGGFGNGSLTVSDGAVVTAKTFSASLANLHGNGTINAQGAILDGNMAFGADNPSSLTRSFGSGGTLNVNLNGSSNLGAGHKGQGNLTISDGITVSSAQGRLGQFPGSSGVAVVSGAGTTWVNSSYVYAGLSGEGSLTVKDGASVRSSAGYVAYDTTSRGTATVRGTGSSWINQYDLHVGAYGDASMTIADGGEVRNQTGYLGRYSSGTAVVTGAGSKWVSTASLYVGNSINGDGFLTVRDGGQVTASSIAIGTNSLLRIGVTGSNMVVLGNAQSAGSLLSYGRVDMTADPFLAPGVYRPIAEYADRAWNWTGSGTVTASGGIWNQTARTFTVNQATGVSAGAIEPLSSGERVVFTGGPGERMGASFATVGIGKTFSAVPMNPYIAGDLQAHGTVLTAWDFSTNLTGTPVLLSFDVGGGLDAEKLQVWHYDGSTWNQFQAYDLAYRSMDGVASFTTDSFSGYALVLVPEPGVIMGTLMVGMLAIGRRRRAA